MARTKQNAKKSYDTTTNHLAYNAYQTLSVLANSSESSRGDKKTKMKTVVLYDSIFGNTEKIAKTISKSFKGEVTLTTVKNAKIEDIVLTELLIVGSPVHGGRPTPALEHFLRSLPTRSLENVKVTAFDTRFASEDHGIGLKILMKIIQFAANRIARILEEKGGRIIAPPIGFIVQDKKGPLKTGELQRAQDWANVILKNFNQQKTNN